MLEEEEEKKGREKENRSIKWQPKFRRAVGGEESRLGDSVEK